MADYYWAPVPVWHELMSDDPEQAMTFYREVIGLTTAPMKDAPWPYTLWVHEGNPIGGLIPPQQGQEGWPSGSTPHWVCSFSVPDVDRAVETAQEMDGQVLVPPIDVPGFGRAAVLRDPEGAVFGLFHRDM